MGSDSGEPGASVLEALGGAVNDMAAWVIEKPNKEAVGELYEEASGKLCEI